jgi:hypothetical protein
MTTRHTTTADLRAAIEAALPDLTEDQAQAARAMLDALAPPMDEPTWPGAPVIAACGGARRRLHVRRNDGVRFGWECASYCTGTSWDQLVNPRPLTPAEYAEHGIPAPCTHADRDKQDEAVATSVRRIMSLRRTTSDHHA